MVHPGTRTPLRTATVLVAALALVLTGVLAALRAQPAAAATVTVLSDDFESGLAGWGGRGAATVALDSTDAPRGTQSLKVTGRTASWNGTALDVTTLFEPGTTYTVSAWVRLPNGSSGVAGVRLSAQRDNPSGTSYDTIATNSSVSSGSWAQVTGSYTPGPFATASLYVETTGSLADLLVDDVLVTSTALTPDLTLPSLRETWASSFPLGAAVEAPETLGARSDLLLRHFGQVTVGNAMKPDATHPTEGTWTFAGADQIVDYAVDHDLPVYGHTLLWHQQTPAWFFQRADGSALTTSAEDQALLRSRLQTHIQTFADHFRTTYGEYGTAGNPIFAIDVVNEVIDENQADGLRRSEWYRVLGPSYIADAFRYARAAFGPDVLLFINDYNTEFSNKRAPYLALVEDLLAQGVPVDGVGHQLHVEVGRSISGMEATIAAFEALPVTQAVTELDVSTYTSSGESWTTPPQSRLVEQGYYYRDVFAMLKKHASSLTSVTLWGLDDSRTWLRSGAAPLLFDGTLTAKPAYWGLVDPSRIEGTPTPTPTTPTPTPTSPTPTPTTPTPTPTTPTPTPTPTSGGACIVDYQVTSAWPGGFVGQVTVVNTGPTAVDGWTVRWTFGAGERLTQVWSAAVTQSGSTVTATNLSWNSRLAASGGSTTFGFIGTSTATPAANPTAAGLNGTVCVVR